MLEQAERYTGYTAYDYLEAGKDYRAFTYAKQIDRVPEYSGPRPERLAGGAHRATAPATNPR